ncbi:ferroxidase fet3 [Coemansia sp. 'formosensis']|nr:ferroxidase fet3 [Coemansia sp. 'formosensis']
MYRALLGIYIVAAAYLLLCQAARVVCDWDIGYLNVNRDGYTTRRAIGVNGQLPIPPVYATKGDTLVINVHNSLDTPTTIHAHGLFMKGSSYMDGAGQITQCGIPPGENFTYEINADRAGTFWIHGHYNHQNVDGLRTSLVIHDTGPPVLDYDEDKLVFLEEWYPYEFIPHMAEVMSPLAPFPPPPSFPYGLVNGVNGNDTTPITFVPGRKYRFRVINMSTTEWFKFSLPGHKLTIIEADGTDSVPHTVDGLDLGPGQRYSVVVTAHDTDAYNYQYNATLYANFVPFIPGMNPRYYLGLIEYKKGAPLKTIAPTADSQYVWSDDILLKARDRQPLLSVDKTFDWTFTTKKNSKNVTTSILDEISFQPPLVPPLFSAFSMGDLALNETIYGPQTRAHVLRLGEVVEIVLHNPSGLDHAMHLHGHAFQVTEYGPSGTPANSTTLPVPIRKFTDWPMRRDTFVVRSYQYIKVRFYADNPGVWLFHCHMDVHFSMGMAVTFVEAPDVLQKQQTIPQALIDMCHRQGIVTSGNGAGNAGFNLTGLPPVLR